MNDLSVVASSLIMEEAAQVLDVETLIPLLLQHHDEVNGCRLKRITLIGDHYQLPPIIQNLTLQKYSKYDQSLFTRLIRLGVPSIILDQQGRARPEISNLYNWRYKRPDGQCLRDLKSVVETDLYRRANTGFLYSFQLIDVGDFKGKGEFAPTPYFYQNLGEAEYIVATYQYMRLMGYPAEKISILTTYNGQKHLIMDILRQRCKNASIFGFPKSVSTVDKYQGQQNDYILLSLVRTESIGHIRDVRRLVVALSRGKLGVYIFCKKSLFENCYELSPAFGVLATRSDKLQLIVGENYPTPRLITEHIGLDKIYTVNDVTMLGVLVYQLTEHAMNFQSSKITGLESHDEHADMQPSMMDGGKNVELVGEEDSADYEVKHQPQEQDD